MFWTLKQTALFLGLDIHQVYYLLSVGEIEAVKVSWLWRVMPDSALSYKEKRAA